MNECVFCAEVEHEDANVFRRSVSGLLAARWDRFPIVPGHVEIIPVRHVQYVKDLSLKELSELMVFASEVARVVETTNLRALYEEFSAQASDAMSADLLAKAIVKVDEYAGRKPEGYTYGINDGSVAGQSIGHMHLHILPRWKGDVANPRGGVRNIFAGDPYSLAS